MPRLLALSLGLLLFLLGHESLAATPRPLLIDYTHTSWTEVHGAPSSVTRFTQGKDGWLWLASPTGLYRFDGVRFERTESVFGFPLQSSNLMVVNAAKDGALWVGYRVGTVSVFRKGETHTYAESDGLQPVGVMDIKEAPDGAVWVAMRDGLAILPPGGKRFQYFKEEVGLPPRGIFQILFARNGTTWLGTNRGIYFREKGQSRFSHAFPRLTVVSLTEAEDGTIWAGDLDKQIYKILPHAVANTKPEFSGQGALLDRRGAMWVWHNDSIERKLFPYRPSKAGQYLTRANSLSGPVPVTAFEDREGNLWFGTSRGVDRLRPNRLATMPVPAPLREPALVLGPAGHIWVGDYQGDTWSYDGAGSMRREAPGPITASFTSPDGVIWLGGMEGVKRLDTNGKVTLLPFPDNLKGLRVHALQQDRDGALWGSFSTGRGIYKLVNGVWLRNDGLHDIPETLTTTLALDSAGSMWLGHLRSEVTVIGKAAQRRFGPQQGLQVGTILSLAPDCEAMWIGGENGVTMYRDGRFRPLRGERNERFSGVSGIARLPNGELWLHGAEGLYRIAATDLAAWLDQKTASVNFARFDAQDGMQGHASQWRPLPSLRYTKDGLLWYATNGSVGAIDPAHVLHNPLPPPIEIISLQADGAQVPLPGSGELALPQGTHDVQIDFTALSLSIPERVRMRYRLIGWDRTWRETSGRRDASYTNLAPGEYRFEVTGANEDGVWNTQSTSLVLHIPPTFVQSIWFKLLLAIAFVLMLYLLYVLRIRYLTKLIQERTAERTRIARTLHDTLLQSVQALLLSFDGLSRHLKDGSRERLRLDQTLHLAEQLLVEGRDQIMDLRATASPEALALTLEDFGKGLAEHRAHAFATQVTGAARQLRIEVHEEVYAIGREALFNASRYAEATCISLALEYNAANFILRVSDNGRGLDESIATAGGRPGHWGLFGMRERAQSIGAELAFHNRPGAGLHITLTLPSRRAYPAG